MATQPFEKSRSMKPATKLALGSIVLLLALVPQLVGHTTYNWALRYLPASLVAIATLGEPVGSTILAYLFLQEDPGWLKVYGGALILAGIWLAVRKGKG